jgi:hypothetical protein
MSWRVGIIVLLALALVAVITWLVLRQPATPPAPVPVTEPEPLPTPTPAPEDSIVLLFAGFDGMLHPELREVPLPAELDVRVRTVVDELLRGPRGNLRPVVPYPAEVAAVFVDSRAVAYVDLTPPPKPLEGSNVEIMLVYGIVDSVLLNCPELEAVQILFGGREVDTLTGHLDLSQPLVLNRRFVASS